MIEPRPIVGATTDTIEDTGLAPSQSNPLLLPELSNEYEVAISLIAVIQTVYKLDVPMDVRLESAQHYPTIGEGASFTVKRDFRAGSHPSQAGEIESVLKVSRQSFSSGFKKFMRAPFVTLMQELSVLGHSPLLKHRNIVDLQKVGWAVAALDPLEICPILYIERAPHGNLTEFEKSGVAVSHEARRGLCLDVCRGLEALHSCGIVHGDVKAENVLVYSDGKEGYVAKLSDFGCSIILSKYASTDSSSKIRLPGLSPPWHAPEALDPVPISQLPNTDVYSLGLLLWRILVFDNPFNIFDLPLNPAIRMEEIREILSLPHFPALIVHFITDVYPRMNQKERTSYATVFITALAQDPFKRNLAKIIEILQAFPSSVAGSPGSHTEASRLEGPSSDVATVPALSDGLKSVGT
jgi:serine/threonine protein kinase